MSQEGPRPPTPDESPRPPVWKIASFVLVVVIVAFLI